MMKAEIISIGDELLLGQTVNSNASYIAKGLTGLGIEVHWITTIGDDADELVAALRRAMQRSDIIITTGGLGPTHDDITKTVTADFFDSGFTFKQEILDEIRERFEQRGIEMAEINREQAEVPEKAKVIPNPVGTAPGLNFERDGKKCIVLPGVPSEMKAMCEETVFPMFSGQGRVILIKTIRTTGVPESALYEQVGDVGEIEAVAKVAFLPKATGVDIRLTVSGSDAEACQERLDKASGMFKERIGEHIYAYDDQNLEDLVAGELTALQKTLAVAESCSGGLLADKLTNIPGSSVYFERGVVAYSNKAKTQLLDISQSLLEAKGAVSEEVARAMAENVRELAGADFGLSTTGIAGPGGGSAEKPVGLVYIGFASRDNSYSQRFVFTKDRLTNKERTVQAALNILRKELSKSE